MAGELRTSYSHYVTFHYADQVRYLQKLLENREATFEDPEVEDKPERGGPYVRYHFRTPKPLSDQDKIEISQFPGVIEWELNEYWEEFRV